MENQTQTLVRIPTSLYEELRRVSFEERISQSEITRQALELYFKRAEKKGEQA